MKTKKKIFAFILALCLLGSFAACGSSGTSESSTSASSTEETGRAAKKAIDAAKGSAEEKTEDAAEAPSEEGIVGIFKLVKAESSDEGASISEEDVQAAEASGTTFYIEFAEDGTYSVYSFGDEFSGTYDDTSMDDNGNLISYTLDGDTLTLTEENDDIVMTLQRSSQAEIDSILANAPDDEDDGLEPETDDEEEEDKDNDAAPASLEGDYVQEEQVLLDTNDFSVTVRGYEENEWGEFIVKLTLENKTEDVTLSFDASDAAVNGYVIYPFLYTDVTPGNKSNEDLTFYVSDLEEAGITSIDEIRLKLWVSDADDYMADDYYNDVVTFYPTGKSADEIVSSEPDLGNAQVFVDDGNCTFAILSIEHDEDLEDTDVIVYLENKTDTTLMFAWDNVSVNGYMIDPYWASSIMPGTKAYTTIYFEDSELEENDITDITSIEFELTVYNDDDWSADDLIDETFTYNP